MHINKDNLTPQRPSQEQKLDLTQDFLDDDQMETQLPTNLSLSDAETQHNAQRTSSPKIKTKIKDQAFKIPKNPKKLSLRRHQKHRPQRPLTKDEQTLKPLPQVPA